MMKKAIFIIAIAAILTACGNSFQGVGGELTGASAAAWNEPSPHGMVLIKRGAFNMGPAETDSLWGIHQNVKGVSIDAFWMDATEITNAQYRQFLYFVRDSIVRERLYEIDDRFKIEEDRYGEPIDPPILNWNRPIPTERRANEDELAAINSVYAIHPVTKEKKLDARQMVYRYHWYDHTSASLRRYRLDPAERVRNTDIQVNPNEIVMISKDTAYINEEGVIIRETITRPLSSYFDFLNTYIVNVYPDETTWLNDFNNAYNEPYVRLYFNHPGFNDYPVVGISWEQATAFCAWRTNYLMMSANLRGRTIEPYRLPTEAEWEYAARSGRNENKYPWSQDGVTGNKGCFLANFKPDRGNYVADGHLITNKVASFSPNEFGLYDMAGNVAEWTSTAFLESGPEIMSDMNPEYRYIAAKEDPYALKRKVVRGGSWKDVAHLIRSDIRSFEFQNEQRSFIGFRCVRTQVGVGKK